MHFTFLLQSWTEANTQIPEELGKESVRTLLGKKKASLVFTASYQNTGQAVQNGRPSLPTSSKKENVSQLLLHHTYVFFLFFFLRK